MMYGMINNHGTQDWQVEAYERQNKTNPFIWERPLSLVV